MDALKLLPTSAQGWTTPQPWDTVLGLSNGSRVVFKRRPTYGGTIQLAEFVEQITETIVPGMWSTSIITLPTQDQQMWVMGDSAYGLLNETARTSY